MARSSVERVVRSARLRLVVQRLLNDFTSGGAVATALSLVWMLLEPLVLADRPAWLPWAVLASGLAAAGLVAVARTAFHVPSRLAAALAVDERFQLDERLTSALSLPPAVQTTPFGAAVLADAAAHAKPLRVRDRFPVRLRRTAGWIPLLAGLMALAAFVYHPVADSAARAEARKQADAAGVAANDARPKPLPKAPPRGAARRPRPAEQVRGGQGVGGHARPARTAGPGEGGDAGRGP